MIVEKNWFHNLPQPLQLLFKNICYRTNLEIICNEAQRFEKQYDFEISKVSRNSVSKIHCWTAQNKKRILGWSIQLIDSNNTLRGTCLFRIEMKPPHACEKKSGSLWKNSLQHEISPLSNHALWRCQHENSLNYFIVHYLWAGSYSKRWLWISSNAKRTDWSDKWKVVELLWLYFTNGCAGWPEETLQQCISMKKLQKIS